MIFPCNHMDMEGMRERGLDLHINGEKLKATGKLKLLGLGLDPQLRGKYQAGIINFRVAPRIRALKLLASARWAAKPVPFFRSTNHTYGQF